MFRFGNPEYLWLFAALPLLLALYIFLNIRKKKDVEKMGTLSMLKRMMPELSLKRSYLKFWLIFGALCVGIFLLARPQFGTKVELVERRESSWLSLSTFPTRCWPKTFRRID